MTDPKSNSDSPESVPETAGENAPAAPDALAEALLRAEKAEAELARLKDGALRAMADAENVKKRAEREIGEREKYAVAGFAKALDSALKGVSQLQQESSSLQRQYQLGAGGVSLEDTMVAMQKAQIGFQAAVTVRNRLVSAYTDIMNMQV